MTTILTFTFGAYCGALACFHCKWSEQQLHAPIHWVKKWWDDRPKSENGYKYDNTIVETFRRKNTGLKSGEESS